MTKSNERAGSDASWQTVHEKLRSLAQERSGLDFEEGRWLLAARKAVVHRELGYGSFTEYVERLFGYAPRVTHDKLRVAAALQALPEISDRLSEGELSYSHARELTRVATPETENQWLEATRGRTVREVEKLVSGRRPGALPGSPPEPPLERHVLRFEVSGETLASFRAMVAHLRQEAGEHLDDDALLLMLARHVLGGPIEDGRASYQIALDVCEGCQRARQVADGETIDVSRAAAEMARCDAQRVPRAHVGANADAATSRATQDVPPATRRLVLRRDHHRCQVPGCKHATWVDVHHVQTRADGGEHDPNNLLTLCGVHHRAAHEGALIITGSGAASLEFWHADGTSYGACPDAPRADVLTQVFQALRGLGFKEGEAKRALDRARQDLPTEREGKQVLRHCLSVLTERACFRV